MQTLDWADKDKTLPLSDERRWWKDVNAAELKTKFNANVTEYVSDLAGINSALAARLISANIVKRETPGGAINGSNTAFTVANPLVAGSEELFRNGILQDITTSYTISGQNITMIVAPETGDSLKINYIKS